jgi:hypothetical protein
VEPSAALACRTACTDTPSAPARSSKVTDAIMVALYTCWYNFARINSAVRMSPAMACGLKQRLWDVGDIVKLIEEWDQK